MLMYKIKGVFYMEWVSRVNSWRMLIYKTKGVFYMEWVSSPDLVINLLALFTYSYAFVTFCTIM